MEILEGFSFSNEIFIFLFSLVFIVNFIVYDFNILRKLFLIVISISIFLILTDFNLISFYFLVFVILINFILGLILNRFKNKSILFLGILFNISLLLVIKYPEIFNFIKKPIFIIGISFFVLNNISFLVDVFNDKILSEIDIFDFIIFLLYFPKILIGPLVRYNDFYLELNHNNNFPNLSVFYMGIFLFIWGLVKKIGADYISMFPLTIYSNPHGYSGFEHLTAMYGYTLYIYLDFSGYSDIALGLSLLLGIELTKNFNYPYLSGNIREFWRNWHISLSNWIRDYIYIPLGGNKKGKLRENLNILCAFIFSGFWHGIGINFFIWSIIHGLAVILSKGWFSFLKYFNNTFITFNFIAVSWIFFANKIEDALISISKILYNIDINSVLEILLNNYDWYLFFSIIFLCIFLERKILSLLNGFFINVNYFIKAFIVFIILYLLIISKEGNIKPFVYQQF